MKISKIAGILGDSPTLELNALVAKLKASGEPLIHLGGGEPEAPIPPDAIKAVEKKINAGQIKYTPASGTLEMKKAVVQYTKKHYKHEITPKNVVICGGAKQGIYNFLVSAVDAGDEVVFSAPYWVSYPEMVKLVGGVPVVIMPPKGELEPTFEQFKKAITDKTTAVFLNSPNNPSGAVYSEELISSVVKYCEEKGIYLIMDDIYHQLISKDCKMVSCYDYSKKPDNIVVINGISKLYGMTGFRIGWTVASEEITAVMGKVQAQTTSCPSDLSQAAAVAALHGDQQCVENLKSSLERNRNVIIEELGKLKKVKLKKPKGTFYCLPDFSQYNPDSVALSKFLLEKVLVATVPGKPFGFEGHLRISYCCSEDKLREGIKRIVWALEGSDSKEIDLGDKKVVRTWS
jgi:aspartate aminotransferase